MFIPWDLDIPVYLITRSKVRGVLLGRASGGASIDSQIIKYLANRFSPDVENRGKGNKKDPGWFYRFKGDVWQAYALGVAYYDMKISENKKEIKYLEGGMINGY
jgi:hypothetical protein